MLDPGRRSHRVRFERQVAEDDGYGNRRRSWAQPEAVATVWAAFRPVFGREQVAAGRLESTLTGTLTVLRSTVTRSITPADRVVFAAGPYAGTACNIRSIVPTPDNAEIEMTLESGVAT